MDDLGFTHDLVKLKTSEANVLPVLLNRLFKRFHVRFDILLWNKTLVCIGNKSCIRDMPKFVLNVFNPRVLHCLIQQHASFDFMHAIKEDDIEVIGDVQKLIALNQERVGLDAHLRVEACDLLNQLRLNILKEKWPAYMYAIGLSPTRHHTSQIID